MSEPLTQNTAPQATRRATPLYQIVEDHIRTQIQSGAWVPGDLIPSEARLSRQLDVSQGTAKKAIDNLVWQGMLYRHQGKGTFVSRVDFNNSLFRFFSYGDHEGQAIRIRKTTTERKLKLGAAAPVNVYERLAVPQDTELLYIERIGSVKNQATFIEYSWWIAEQVPGLEDETLHIPDLFYALIVDRYDLPIIRADETLTAEAADPYTAEKLDIHKDSPVVVLNRNTYSRDEKIVEVRTTKGRADRFSYRREIR